MKRKTKKQNVRIKVINDASKQLRKITNQPEYKLTKESVTNGNLEKSWGLERNKTSKLVIGQYFDMVEKELNKSNQSDIVKLDTFGIFMDKVITSGDYQKRYKLMKSLENSLTSLFERMV